MKRNRLDLVIQCIEIIPLHSLKNPVHRVWEGPLPAIYNYKYNFLFYKLTNFYHNGPSNFPLFTDKASPSKINYQIYRRCASLIRKNIYNISS